MKWAPDSLSFHLLKDYIKLKTPLTFSILVFICLLSLFFVIKLDLCLMLDDELQKPIYLLLILVDTVGIFNDVWQTYSFFYIAYFSSIDRNKICILKHSEIKSVPGTN